jgi:hypothetical protein
MAAASRSSERSIALFGEKERAISELYSLAVDCSYRGWDGEDASPIAPLVLKRAAGFLRAMPNGVPLPESAPEPDGSISFDWIASRTRVFSLSIGTNDRIAYAWTDGTDRGHAVARFDGDSLPPRILTGIREIVNGPTFRAA